MCWTGHNSRRLHSPSLHPPPCLVTCAGLFGYMILLIVLKWSIDWRDPASRPGAPPSLIDTMINIVLKPGAVNDAMYEGQAGVQTLILLVVFATVPIMLVVKPYLLHRQAQAKKKAKAEDNEKHGLLEDGKTPAAGAAHGSQGSGASSTSVALEVDGKGASPAGHVAHAAAAGGDHGGHGHEEEHEHGFGELFIHQAIETIEFVLGSVSNTASYLRLWALSLAHSQLATVFWERALVATIEMNSTMYVVVGFYMFASITMAVLLIMDVLECFLHALRLHWVEFQNKVSAQPYCFPRCMVLLAAHDVLPVH